MRLDQYSQVYPTFWMGNTGKAIKSHGVYAQLLAMYLITSPHSNMAGLYYCPSAYVESDTGIPAKQIAASMEQLEGVGFCDYDWENAWVFVHAMVRFQVGESLSSGDKRCGKLVDIVNNCGSEKLRGLWVAKHRGIFAQKWQDKMAHDCPIEGA